MLRRWGQGGEGRPYGGCGCACHCNMKKKMKIAEIGEEKEMAEPQNKDGKKDKELREKAKE